MKFFDNFYKYNEEGPDLNSIENSIEYIEECKRIDKLGDEYNQYLNKISKSFPKGFLDKYHEYYQFQGWDLEKLEFNHSVYNHPCIEMTLTHVNINKVIFLRYIDVKSFSVDINENYFGIYMYGKPGFIGVNEFNLNGKILSHKIYFYSPEYIKIDFKKLEFHIHENKKNVKKWFWVFKKRLRGALTLHLK